MKNVEKPRGVHKPHKGALCENYNLLMDTYFCLSLGKRSFISEQGRTNASPPALSPHQPSTS